MKYLPKSDAAYLSAIDPRNRDGMRDFSHLGIIYAGRLGKRESNPTSTSSATMGWACAPVWSTALQCVGALHRLIIHATCPIR